MARSSLRFDWLSIRYVRRRIREMVVGKISTASTYYWIPILKRWCQLPSQSSSWKKMGSIGTERIFDLTRAMLAVIETRVTMTKWLSSPSTFPRGRFPSSRCHYRTKGQYWGRLDGYILLAIAYAGVCLLGLWLERDPITSTDNDVSSTCRLLWKWVWNRAISGTRLTICISCPAVLVWWFSTRRNRRADSWGCWRWRPTWWSTWTPRRRRRTAWTSTSPFWRRSGSGPPSGTDWRRARRATSATRPRSPPCPFDGRVPTASARSPPPCEAAGS